MFAASRGYRIRYQVFGSAGPALVLLHGFPMWGERWRDAGYVDALQERFRVIVPDLLGHGLSDKPHDPAAYGKKNMASDVLSVLNDAGAEQAHVWGYSMGAFVATALAVLAPGRVLSLLLGGAPPGLTVEQIRADQPPDVPETWEDMLSGLPPHVIDFFKQHNEDFAALQALSAANLTDDFAAAIGDLQATPHATLAYIGADDHWLDLTRQQCAALPCRLEVVPGDHALAFRQSENVIPLVLDFLDSDRTSRRG